VSGAARTPEPAAAADFVFVPTTRPRRFAWAIDRSGGFAEIGPGLAETLGPAAAPRLGETWAEAARRLVIDPEATIAGHLDGRQPWHAATLAWPVEGKALRVPVDLTAMPLADANGAYEGFRGFGVIRADAATDDPLATGLMLAKRRPETAASPDLIPTPESATASVDVMLQSVVATEDDDATDEPADAPLPHMMSHVAPDARAVPMTFSADNRFPRLVPPTEAASDEHFLTLMPAAHISPETLRLSGAERNAFRQIAEALGARFEGDEDLMTSSPSPASRAPEPEPVRILSTRGLLDELNRPPAELPTRTLATAGSLADAADGWQSTEGGDTRLIDRLPIAVGLTRDEAVIHVNATFLALTGYADLDDLNRAGGLDALFAGPHAAKGWAGERNRHHIPLVTKSGRVVPVDARIASVPWVGGTALLITLIAADRPGLQVLPETATAGATAAGQGDRVVELEERVRELDAVLATASDGIVMLGADGRVRSANGPAAVLFGYDPAIEPSPLIGKPLAALMAPESQRTANDYLEGLARNGIGSLLIEGRELMGCAQPDRYVPLFATIAKVTTAPEPLFAAVFRDISRWKTSEEELTLAKRRAEEASLQKSDFLAKISHEIRTPLNAIIGFSEVMLGERFGAIGVERYKDYLRDIQSSGTHIMSLVNDLLDLSKVEAGKLDLKFESVQLTELLAECVQLMQPQANRERIIIRASLMQGLPPVVADLRSIRQIVLNLLSNAIKFTPAGGQVIVSAALEETNDVVIRVRDTGYGMSAGDIEIALEPFRQVHNGRGHHTGPGSGTGLGLPLTKALVEANRAALKIDSAVNQGTLVQVTFPAPRVLAAE